jgi:hypothetical protein
MVRLLAPVLLVGCLFSATLGVSISSSLKSRDENLPARVPYIFPAPGTDPVRNATPKPVTNLTELQIADKIRSRRTNGTLLALDGTL